MLDLERRRPLADLMIASNHALGPVSSGLHEAADNLLRKAVRAVRDGDQARARRFVERALDLPFDEHEQIGPAWWSASMLMFTAITDYAEDCEVGDDSWLTAAEHVVGHCDPLAVPAVLGCLAAIVNDYAMSAAETRRGRRLVAASPPDAWDEHEPTDRAQRLSAILAVVDCVVAYETAEAQVSGGSNPSPSATLHRAVDLWLCLRRTIMESGRWLVLGVLRPHESAPAQGVCGESVVSVLHTAAPRRSRHHVHDCQ